MGLGFSKTVKVDWSVRPHLGEPSGYLGNRGLFPTTNFGWGSHRPTLIGELIDKKHRSSKFPWSGFTMGTRYDLLSSLRLSDNLLLLQHKWNTQYNKLASSSRSSGRELLYATKGGARQYSENPAPSLRTLSVFPISGALGMKWADEGLSGGIPGWSLESEITKQCRKRGGDTFQEVVTTTMVMQHPAIQPRA